MDLTNWIRPRAATGQSLNLHAVKRERPDLLEQAFGGPAPCGWRKSLIAAGVDPYKIEHAHQDHAACGICGLPFAVLGSHLKKSHGMSGPDYIRKLGPDHEVSSESFRVAKFSGQPIAGIEHWERLWSRHYVTDWIILLHEEGHPLNYHHVLTIGHPLATSGLTLFGTWDAALRHAGLSPELLRSRPPNRQWTKAMAIEGLRNLAKLKQEDSKREMSNPLRMAITRFFRTPQAACKAVGIAYEDINFRAFFKGERVTNLVAAIRTLENLKGRERYRRLDAIVNRNKDNHRIVVGLYGSLRRLAAKEGIAPGVVATAMYRDEADVQHDLDLLEQQGKTLSYGTLKNGHRRLYNVIRENGWGADRLKRPQPVPTKFPPCNPRSGLLRDRMIILRRRLRISTTAAANMAGLSMDCWIMCEKGQSNPKAATVAKIERLLAEHQIPVSTAPHTPAG